MKTNCKNCRRSLKSNSRLKGFCSVTCREFYCKSKIAAAINKNLIRPAIANENKIEYRKINSQTLLNEIAICSRSSQFWILCQSVFWPFEDFTETEKHKFKQLISEHFLHCNDIDEKFKELVEKVILTQRFIQEKPYRQIDPPGAWLNIKFLCGLSGAAQWYEALTRHRKERESFSSSTLLFAQAILKYVDTRNILDIVFYRQLFLRDKEFELLKLYLNFVTHIEFISF